MIKIFYDQKELIYFNHERLIDESYRNYKLKHELFNFSNKKPKCTEEATNDNLARMPNVKGNNKLKRTKSICLTNEMSALDQDCKRFLAKIKSTVAFPLFPSECELPHYWDEAMNFPKFHGENNTGIFQSYALNNRTYLIPPMSRFFNHNVNELQRLLPELSQFDLIVIDPPWRNKYIRRLKRVRQELSYQMLSNEDLRNLPIGQLIHKRSLVAIWCTNSSQHQTALLEEFLPEWNLQLLHPCKWLKLNINGEPIGSINNAGQKQPFEMLFIARHQEADEEFATAIKQVEMLFSVPSIIHSHKPPLHSWLGQYLRTEPKCLEIFARYLQPNFTSLGLEVLKLMDERLYIKT